MGFSGAFSGQQNNFKSKESPQKKKVDADKLKAIEMIMLKGHQSPQAPGTNQVLGANG
jgi:hypothetical protein